MGEVWLAVILAPCVLAVLQALIARSSKREDWRRQDEVAARAEKVARLAAGQITEAAGLLLENNKVVAQTAEVTNTKLDVIHTLVNSNMTSALQGELNQARGTLVALRELIALRRLLKEEPDEETRVELATLEEKIKGLAANLNDRLEQTKVADAQIFIAKETKHNA